MARLNVHTAVFTILFIISAPVITSAETFVHPSGLSLTLPAQWTVRTEGPLIQLVPPDATSNAHGPTEAYLLLVGPTHGASRVDEPALANALDTQMTQLAPFLRRMPTTATFAAGERSGVVLSWEGVNQQGDSIQARLYSVMGDGWVGAILAIAHVDRLQAREATLNEMATAMRVVTPQRDRNIVGRWVYTKSSSYVSGDFSMATMTRSTASLSDDGRIALSQTSQVAGGNSDVTADTGADGNTFRGTWYAADGMICIVTEQAVINARYVTDGQNLRIIASDMDRTYSRR